MTLIQHQETVIRTVSGKRNHTVKDSLSLIHLHVMAVCTTN